MNPLSATTERVAVTRLAFSGVAAVSLLNLLLRSLVHWPGVLTTLLVAATVAVGMRLWFAGQHRRAPLPSERRCLLGIYAAVLALLYLALLALMAWQDQPSRMALFIFALHYFCYPLLAWLAFSHRFARRNP